MAAVASPMLLLVTQSKEGKKYENSGRRAYSESSTDPIKHTVGTASSRDRLISRLEAAPKAGKSCSFQIIVFGNSYDKGEDLLKK